MRVSGVSILAVLAQSAVLTLARPTATSTVVQRSQFCANAPTTKAGTMFHRRTVVESTSINILSREATNSHSVLWCAPNSQTYIVITMAQTIPGMGIVGILSSAYEHAHQHIESMGDGVIRALSNGRVFQLQGVNGLGLSVFNANNHQTTWGVLASAMVALVDFMAGQGTYCAAAFSIYDGQNEVGTGSLGLY